MPPTEGSHMLWLVVVFYYYLETLGVCLDVDIGDPRIELVPIPNQTGIGNVL
jgi:hypothetical protein